MLSPVSSLLLLLTVPSIQRKHLRSVAVGRIRAAERGGESTAANRFPYTSSSSLFFREKATLLHGRDFIILFPPPPRVPSYAGWKRRRESASIIVPPPSSHTVGNKSCLCRYRSIGEVGRERGREGERRAPLAFAFVVSSNCLVRSFSPHTPPPLSLPSGKIHQCGEQQ